MSSGGIGLVLIALSFPPAAGRGTAETAHAPQLEDARDATGEGLAFVELSAGQPEYYLHQPIPLTVRFGLEESFLRTSAVQPFRQRLDVPAQIFAPWIENLSGTRALGLVEEPADGDPGERASFALNGGIRLASRVADRFAGGLRFQVYEVEARFLPVAVGELRIPGPSLRFARATRFEESLLDERVPVDRDDVTVSGEPLALRIRPLPEEGRPWAFTGAVGRFTVRAEVPSPEVRVRESLKLLLTIEGEGNLAWFEAPDWREIGDLRVLGILDETTGSARVLTIDLSPKSATVRQIPAVSFAYFDPGPPASYRTAETEPVDVVVRGGSGREDGRRDPSGEEERTPPHGIQETPGETRTPSTRMLLLCSAVGLGLLALVALVVARRRA